VGTVSTLTRNRFRAAAMAIAPLVLLAAFLYHPFLTGAGAPAPEVVAEAAEADPTRWATAHLLALAAFALMALAFQALRGRLRDAGEQRWSSWAFPLVIVGFVFLAGLPAIELGITGAIEAGGDTVALVEAVNPWFMTLLIIGGAAFVLGCLGFAMGVVRGAGMGRGLTAVVAIALVVTALALAAPPFWAFYVMAAAAIVAFWPLAWTTAMGGPARVAGTGEVPATETPATPRPRAAQEEPGGIRAVLHRRHPPAHH
jgi:hypothetical protein